MKVTGADEPTEPPPVPAGEATQERFLLHAPRAVFVGKAMIALNVAWFLWMAFNGVSITEPGAEDGLRFGANYGPAIAGGEWWRLLTAAFVHYGVLHLGMNMWALWVLAPFAERLYGSGGYLLLYLLGAIGCSAASMLMGPGKFSAGASGAVFATMGGIFVFFLMHRRAMPRGLFAGMMRSIGMLLGINLVLGLMHPGIDNAGHFGGLAAGIAAGWCLDRDPALPPRMDAKRIGAAFFLGLMLAGLCTFIPARVAADPGTGASLALARADEAERRRDWAAAERYAGEALETDADNAEALFLRARARAEMDRLDAALEDCDRLLAAHPGHADARKLRALMHAERGRFDVAHEDLALLARSDPSDAIVQRMLGLGELARGGYREAALALDAAVQSSSRDAGSTQLALWMARALLGLHEEAQRGLDEFARSLPGQEVDADTALLLSIARGETPPDAPNSIERLDSRGRALARLALGIRALKGFGGAPDRAAARTHLEAAEGTRDPWLEALRLRLLREL